MKNLVVVFTLFLLAVSSAALDLKSPRGKVKDRANADGTIDRIIDPDRSIFGVPFGTTEEEFVERFGEPTGYLQLTPQQSGMLYGKSHFFFFKDEKLSGVRIARNIVDWNITRAITDFTKFDRVRWELSNGIREEVSKAQVKKLLGDRLKEEPGGYMQFYETETSRVELNFSHYTGFGDGDEAFRLFGLTVLQK